MGDNQIKGLSVSFSPNNGGHDEFDYKLSLDQSKYLGIESDNMKIKGSGKIVHAGQEGDGEDFTIEGPVTRFKVAFEVLSEEKKAGSKKIDFKGVDLTLEDDKVQIASASAAFNEHGHSSDVKKWV